MNTFKIFILLFFSTVISYPYTSARNTIPFHDGWLFKKGPFPSDPLLFSSAFADKWTEVTIPHTWNAKDMQSEKNNFYQGETYYKKSYSPSIEMKEKRIFLRFEGVASVASIYINNSFAGEHKGGYSTFALEITDLLKYGEENEILVKVNNQSRPDVIPVNHTLFGVYGGIYRPVSLIITDRINISVSDYASSGIYIYQENVSAKSASVNIQTKLENRFPTLQNISLVNTIYDMEGKKVDSQKTEIFLSPQGRQYFQQVFTLNKPRLWQGLEDPYLYKVVTQIIHNDKIIDEVIQPLGLRHIEIKAADGVYLNGKKIPMYGVCRHQDWLGVGSALTNEHHDTDLAIIKEMGATTIRFAHYQQSEYIYSKCDSIGFLVWAEIPFVNRVSTEETENAKQQLTELIRQNYNHPSIYVWGLHNEVYRPHEYTSALTTTLHDLAKTEDPYRYTVAVNGYGHAEHPVNMNADIQGFNRYFGWYERKIHNLQDWVQSLEKDYPHHKVILAEYGAEANIYQQDENVGDFGNFFSQFYPETFSTKFHEIQWGIISQSPYLLASYLWNTFDFATPATAQGGIPARNMKGLVTFDRKVKKDPYYWYKANWSKEPVLYLTQRRATERKNQATSITVYSNIGIPELYVNNKLITNYKEGTTSVHYIFENIHLQEGENSIVAKITSNGQTYTDTITWNYIPSPKTVKTIEQKENLKEHGGL